MFSILLNQPYNDVNPSFQIANNVFAIAREMGVNEALLNKTRISISGSPLNSMPAGAQSSLEDGKWKPRIIVNHLWLMDWSHLPSHLKIRGAKDHQLGSRAFIQKFSDYIAEEFGLTKRKVTMEQMITLRFFVKLAENPEKVRSAWRALIAHEFGHLEHDHCKKRMHWEPRARLVAAVATVILSTLAVILSATWSPYFLVAAVAAPILGYGSYQFANLLFLRGQELEADRFAAEHLEDVVPGAKYGFTCSKVAIKDTKGSKDLTFLERIISKVIFVGNEWLIGRFVYGSLASRIKRIKRLAAAVHTPSVP